MIDVARLLQDRKASDNGSTPNKNPKRKVESLGTKTGGTRSLQVTITLS